MLKLGECQSLDANNLPYEVYLSPVPTATPSNNSLFYLFDLKSDKLRCLAVPAQIFAKQKCTVFEKFMFKNHFL